jgi:hypothetical protein
MEYRELGRLKKITYLERKAKRIIIGKGMP